MARDFFKKYKVLFSAVWEMRLDCTPLQDYFRGFMPWNELMTNFFDVGEMEYYKINHCKDLSEIESCVRKNGIFNMDD